VCGSKLAVLRVQRVECARQLFERGLGVEEAEVTRFLEGRKRLGDACYGIFIRCDVEVRDCVADELSAMGYRQRVVMV